MQITRELDMSRNTSVTDITPIFPSFKNNLKKVRKLMNNVDYLRDIEIKKSLDFSFIELVKEIDGETDKWSQPSLFSFDAYDKKKDISANPIEEPVKVSEPEEIVYEEISNEDLQGVKSPSSTPKADAQQTHAERVRDVLSSDVSNFNADEDKFKLVPEENYASANYTTILNTYATKSKTARQRYQASFDDAIENLDKTEDYNGVIKNFSAIKANEMVSEWIKREGISNAVNEIGEIIGIVDSKTSGDIFNLLGQNTYYKRVARTFDDIMGDFPQDIVDEYKRTFIDTLRSMYDDVSSDYFNAFVRNEQTGDVFLQNALKDLPIDETDIKNSLTLINGGIKRELKTMYGIDGEKRDAVMSHIKHHIDNNYEKIPFEKYVSKATIEERNKLLSEFTDSSVLKQLKRIYGFDEKSGNDVLSLERINNKDLPMVINKMMAELIVNPKYEKYIGEAETIVARIFGRNFHRYADTEQARAYMYSHPTFIKSVMERVNDLVEMYNGTSRELNMRFGLAPKNVKDRLMFSFNVEDKESITQDDIKALKRLYTTDRAKDLQAFINTQLKDHKDHINVKAFNWLKDIASTDALSFLSEKDNDAGLFLDIILSQPGKKRGRPKTVKEQEQDMSYFNNGLAYLDNPFTKHRVFHVKDLLNTPFMVNPLLLKKMLDKARSDPLRSTGNFEILVKELTPLVTGSYYSPELKKDKDGNLYSREESAFLYYFENPFIQRLYKASKSEDDFKDFVKFMQDAAQDVGVDKDGKSIFCKHTSSKELNDFISKPVMKKDTATAKDVLDELFVIKPVQTEFEKLAMKKKAPAEHAYFMETARSGTGNKKIDDNIGILAIPIYDKFFNTFRELYRQRRNPDQEDGRNAARIELVNLLNDELSSTLFEDDEPFNYFADVDKIDNERIKYGVLEASYILKKLDPHFYKKLKELDGEHINEEGINIESILERSPEEIEMEEPSERVVEPVKPTPTIKPMITPKVEATEPEEPVKEEPEPSLPTTKDEKKKEPTKGSTKTSPVKATTKKQQKQNKKTTAQKPTANQQKPVNKPKPKRTSVSKEIKNLTEQIGDINYPKKDLDAEIERVNSLDPEEYEKYATRIETALSKRKSSIEKKLNNFIRIVEEREPEPSLVKIFDSLMNAADDDTASKYKNLLEEANKNRENKVDRTETEAQSDVIPTDEAVEEPAISSADTKEDEIEDEAEVDSEEVLPEEEAPLIIEDTPIAAKEIVDEEDEEDEYDDEEDEESDEPKHKIEGDLDNILIRPNDDSEPAKSSDGKLGRIEDVLDEIESEDDGDEESEEKNDNKDIPEAFKFDAEEEKDKASDKIHFKVDLDKVKEETGLSKKILRHLISPFREVEEFTPEEMTKMDDEYRNMVELAKSKPRKIQNTLTMSKFSQTLVNKYPWLNGLLNGVITKEVKEDGEIVKKTIEWEDMDIHDKQNLLFNALVVFSDAKNPYGLGGARKNTLDNIIDMDWLEAAIATYLPQVLDEDERTAIIPFNYKKRDSYTRSIPEIDVRNLPLPKNHIGKTMTEGVTIGRDDIEKQVKKMGVNIQLSDEELAEKNRLAHETDNVFESLKNMKDALIDNAAGESEIPRQRVASMKKLIDAKLGKLKSKVDHGVTGDYSKALSDVLKLFKTIGWDNDAFDADSPLYVPKEEFTPYDISTAGDEGDAYKDIFLEQNWETQFTTESGRKQTYTPREMEELRASESIDKFKDFITGTLERNSEFKAKEFHGLDKLDNDDERMEALLGIVDAGWEKYQEKAALRGSGEEMLKETEEQVNELKEAMSDFDSLKVEELVKKLKKKISYPEHLKDFVKGIDEKSRAYEVKGAKRTADRMLSAERLYMDAADDIVGPLKAKSKNIKDRLFNIGMEMEQAQQIDDEKTVKEKTELYRELQNEYDENQNIIAAFNGTVQNALDAINTGEWEEYEAHSKSVKAYADALTSDKLNNATSNKFATAHDIFDEYIDDEIFFGIDLLGAEGRYEDEEGNIKPMLPKKKSKSPKKKTPPKVKEPKNAQSDANEDEGDGLDSDVDTMSLEEMLGGSTESRHDYGYEETDEERDIRERRAAQKKRDEERKAKEASRLTDIDDTVKEIDESFRDMAGEKISKFAPKVVELFKETLVNSLKDRDIGSAEKEIEDFGRIAMFTLGTPTKDWTNEAKRKVDKFSD